jgi:hypothetical protein
MPIHDHSYRHWEGEFKSHAFRWWVITREGLRIILHRKLFLIFILAPPAITFLVHGVMIYFANVSKDIVGINVLVINPKFFFDFLTREIFYIVVICVFGGSSLIANDLKNNALQLYFSKSLTRRDYLLGKYAIIAILMGFVTLLPGIFLFTQNILLSKGPQVLFSTDLKPQKDLDDGEISNELIREFRKKGLFFTSTMTVSTEKPGKKWLITDNQGTYSIKKKEDVLNVYDMTNFKRQYWVLGSIFLYSLIMIIPTGFLIMALSAASRNNRYAAISFVVIAVGTPVLRKVLYEEFRLNWAAFTSYWSNMEILGGRVFGLPSEHGWYWPVVILLVMIGVCVWAMNRRVKGIEIVK